MLISKVGTIEAYICFQWFVNLGCAESIALRIMDIVLKNPSPKMLMEFVKINVRMAIIVNPKSVRTFMLSVKTGVCGTR